jgi:hypothetical protein
MIEALMMDDFPLSLTTVVERAERQGGAQEVVYRRPDASLGRSTFGKCADRARKLASALRRLGIEAGDPTYPHRIISTPFIGEPGTISSGGRRPRSWLSSRPSKGTST